MSEKTDMPFPLPEKIKEQYKVQFVDQYPSDEENIYINHVDTRHFYSLEEAKAFAKKYTHRGRPYYWQPMIFKESLEKRIVEEERWVCDHRSVAQLRSDGGWYEKR